MISKAVARNFKRRKTSLDMTWVENVRVLEEGINIPNTPGRAHLKKEIKPIFNSKPENNRLNFVKYT